MAKKKKMHPASVELGSYMYKSRSITAELAYADDMDSHKQINIIYI
jgi:hypothetical protein